MPVNKFGQYLESVGSGRKDYSPIVDNKLDKKSINCRNKRITFLSKGIAKGDAINKAQLEESINSCLGKIKTISKNINELRHKIENLTVRITTPTSASAAGIKPSKRITPTSVAKEP